MADLPSSNAFGDYEAWPGRDVLDAEGNRLGAVEVIFLDESTRRPEWVRVQLADEPGERLVMVPLAEAEVTVEAIRVVHTRATVVAPPAHGDGGGRLDQNAERAPDADAGAQVSTQPAGAPPERPSGGTAAAGSRLRRYTPPEPEAEAAQPAAGSPEPTAQDEAPSRPEEPAQAIDAPSAGPSRQELLAGGVALASALAALAIVLVRRRRS